MARLHDDEVEVDTDLVRALVTEQLPDLLPDLFSDPAHLPVHEVETTGTVNGIYRLGDHAYARMPRVPRWADGIELEARWLPTIAARVTLEVPEVLGLGQPTDRYPLPWAVHRWIEGQPYADGLVDDVAAAHDLGEFVLELRTLDQEGASPTGRRPLRELDADTRAWLRGCAGRIDVDAAVRAWDRAVEAPTWDGRPVWVHTDLLRPNLLVGDGRLRAVLDFGAVGIGDPAADVTAAWAVFDEAGREAYRAALDVDDGTWGRARGYALHQAAAIIPYYRETNPAFVETAVRTIGQVLADRT